MNVTIYFKLVKKKLSYFQQGNTISFIFPGHLFGFGHQGETGCLATWHGVYEQIKDEKVCREYAETREKTFKTENESGFPRRCYLYKKGTVYFNRHSDGSPESNSKPICRKS